MAERLHFPRPPVSGMAKSSTAPNCRSWLQLRGRSPSATCPTTHSLLACVWWGVRLGPRSRVASFLQLQPGAASRDCTAFCHAGNCGGVEGKQSTSACHPKVDAAYCPPRLKLGSGPPWQKGTFPPPPCLAAQRGDRACDRYDLPSPSSRPMKGPWKIGGMRPILTQNGMWYRCLTKHSNVKHFSLILHPSRII